MVLIDSWPYDLMISGELKLESEITEHPIEEGSEITDHIRPMPIEFTLEAVVSDSPLDDIAQHPSRKAVRLPLADPFATQTVFGPAPLPQIVDPFAPQIVDPFASDTAFGTDQQPLPSAEAHARLTAIWANSQTVTVEIPVASRTGKPGKRTFLNMGLKLLTEMYGTDSDGGMRFSATFRQVTTVSNKRVSARTAIPRGQGQGNAKNKAPFKMTVRKTVLWRIRDVGVLAPDHPFAYVDIGPAKQGQATISDIGQAGVARTGAISYKWSGNGAGTLTEQGFKARPIPAGYAFTPGGELNAAARLQFERDLEVDRDAADFDMTEAIKSDAIERAQEAKVKDLNDRNEAARGPRYTPKGVDMSRFDLDENLGPNFTTPAQSEDSARVGRRNFPNSPFTNPGAISAFEEPGF